MMYGLSCGAHVPLELIGEFSVNLQPGVGSTFRDYSVVIRGWDFSDEDAYSQVVYSHLDQELYTFGLDNTLQYIDAFVGGVLLYEFIYNYEGSGSLNGNIYRWTAEDGETLFIEDVIPLVPYRWGGHW